MTTQLSLLDYQKLGAPHNGTETSIAAAAKAGPKQPRIKDYIWARLLFSEAGITQDEMSIILAKRRKS